MSTRLCRSGSFLSFKQGMWLQALDSLHPDEQHSTGKKKQCHVAIVAKTQQDSK